MDIPKGTKCQEMVASPGQWGAFHPHQCRRNAKVFENGKYWCNTHSPAGVQARRDAATARYKERNVARQAPYKRIKELEQTVTTQAQRMKRLEEACTWAAEALEEHDEPATSPYTGGCPLCTAQAKLGNALKGA